VALTLNKQTENFVLDQGATFIKTFTAKNTAGGDVVISSGTTAAKLRQSIDSSNNIHDFSTSVSGSNVTISMTATNTANVSTDRRYVYDIEFTQSDTSTVERLAEGIVTISPHAGDREFPDIITESISDGQWGSTYWTDYVRNDGAKDRLVTNGTDAASPYWGENNEEHFWEMEGPHHEDIEEMQDVVVAEGIITNSHLAWNQALIRLVGTPNTYNENTSTWSTGSYSALADGEARTGKPFTITSTFSTNFTKITHEDRRVEPNGTVWAMSPKHYGNVRGGGFRLQQFQGRLHFQIGHMGRNQSNYNTVEGFLKPVLGVSANTKIYTNTPSNVYQDPFEYGNKSTTIYQTMNPYDVEEDVRMWYQITCVYNGGPVGYYKPSTRSETEAQLVQNIKDSFKFYQTNLRTGKVHEIDWHHVQMSNKEDYLGFIQGVGYEGDREADTRFGAFCDGAANAYVFEGNWAGTWVTNTALSHSDLQGDTSETKASQPFRVNGFAMDPLGWATKNNKDATNTWIWSPSHHPDRLEDTSENKKDPYPNITSGAADSNYLKASASMDDEDYFQTQADNSYWANNYPLDTA